MPFLTPRPERRHLEMRWADGGSQSAVRRSGVGAVARNGGGGGDGDREVNVQVVLRCRPLNEDEQRANVQSAISCNDPKREVTVLHSLFKQADKTFTFDKVFGPKSQQRLIYDHAVAPIVNDVLEGYNCTVFAFGQTGTGKTYTMEGEMRQKVSELPDTAGVIPRAVRHIFDILEARKADYSMKVTFLELYNEDITDLLALEDQSRFPEDRQKRHITLMEDGKGGAVIRGLEEIVVYSPRDIYSLLERGSARRRTADTALNKQSSRSHAVFSINIHVKETTVGNEELMKCGRLNLVDLAGSENIARSGVREGRAREAGEMNKSLLTLGRVITALVEHSVHVPYRDSKLTRLLRESLGGKAKTCIIATVSPSVHSLEETLVTLDYASRAKSIRNKPEPNQKTCKSVMLKDIYQEMERMKQDVKAAREKNGIYIPHERFVLDEAEKKSMREKMEHLELSLEKQNKEVEKFKALYLAEQERRLDFESQNKDLKVNLESWKGKFLDLQEAHCRANMLLREKDFVISNLLCSENSILERAKDMRNNLENASGDITALLNKLERQSKTEAANGGLLSSFRDELDQSLGVLHNTVVGSVCEQHKILESMNEQTKSYFSAKTESANQLERRIAKAKDMYVSGVQCMKELADTLRKRSIIDDEQMRLTISTHAITVDNFLAMMVSEAEQILDDVLKSTSELKELLAFSAELQQAGLKRSLTSAQAMSKTSIDFFKYIRIHVSRLIKLMEQNQIERSSKLLEFENEFKEICVKDEQAAMNKIAAILSGLTAKKTTMVSAYVGQLNERYSEEQKHLDLEICNLQQISDKGKDESVASVVVVESQFQEDMSSHAKLNDQMEGILQQCLKKVGHSVSYWSHTQSSLHDLCKSSIMEPDDFIEERRNKIENTFEEKLMFSSQNDAEFNAITSDVLTSSKNSLLLDHETRTMIESVSTTFSDHLELLNEKHSKGTEAIRNISSNCLEKDYMANSPIRHRPRELLTNANSLEAIEELRASVPDLVAKFRSENKLDEIDKGKQFSDQRTRTSRSPLMPVNQFCGGLSDEETGVEGMIWRTVQRSAEERGGEGKNKMQSSGEEQSLVSQDNGLSISDTEERRVLEEELSWARLERQKVLALSAEADEAIWHLAALARRTMQERDEARMLLLAGFQARNAQTVMMLPGTSCSGSRVAGPGAFAATGYSQSHALAPAAFGPPGNAAMQGQGQYARAGAGCCVASSSGFGHTSLASPLDAYAAHPAHGGFASSSQDHFDPDMFLVDVAESPQDAVPAAAGSSQERSSGAYGQTAEQKPLQWEGKSAAQDAVLRGAAGHGHAP